MNHIKPLIGIRINVLFNAILVLMVLQVMLSSINVFAASGVLNSDKLNNLKTGNPEYLGTPITDVQTLSAAYGVENGNNMVYTTVTGDPAIFCVYNLTLGAVERTFELTGVYGSWTHIVDHEGNVYIGCIKGPMLYKYTPNNHYLTFIGNVDDVTEDTVTTSIFDMTVDALNNVYLGTYPNGRVVKYSPSEGKLTDMGTLVNGNDYVRAIVYKDGYVYGGGISGDTKFARMNVSTQVSTELATPMFADGTHPVEYKGLVSAGKYIFASILDSGNPQKTKIAIFDTTIQSWLDTSIYLYDSSVSSFVSPEHDGLVYIQNSMPNTKLKTFNINVPINIAKSSTTIIYTSSLRSLPGWATINGHTTLLNISSSGSVISTDITNGSTAIIDMHLPPQPRELRSMENGLNNDVLLGVFMGPKAVSYNTTTGTSELFSMSQVESVGNVNGKTYFGVYPNARIYEFIPTNAYSTSNPKLLNSIGNEQDRPLKIIDAGGKIAISTVADYGFLNGALTIYDPALNTWKTYKGIIEEQSIIGLTYKDGKIYGSTGVWGGLGIDPKATSAKVFICNMDGSVLTSVTPQPPEASSPLLFIGDISFGPDGRLWCVSNGYIFAMNSTTLAIEKHMEVSTSEWSISGARYVPYSIDWTLNGLMITNAAGGIYAVDIATMEYKQLYNNVSLMTLGPGGNDIYFSDNGHYKFYKMPLEYNNERVSTTNYDFENASMISTWDSSGGGLTYGNISINGMNYNDTNSATIQYTKAGTYDGVVFTTYPQNVKVVNIGSADIPNNVLRFSMPYKKRAINMYWPNLTFDSTYTKSLHYKFSFKVKIDNTTSVADPATINLSTVPPTIYGASTFGAYVKFLNETGTEVGTRISAKYISYNKDIDWQIVDFDIPASAIPLTAAKMQAVLYLSTSSACQYIYLDEPSFYVVRLVGKPIIKDSNGIILTKLRLADAGTNVTATVNISDMQNGNSPVLLIMALYDRNGRLVDLQKVDNGLIVGWNYDITATMHIPAGAIDGKYLKVMVWESFDNFRPMLVHEFVCDV